MRHLGSKNLLLALKSTFLKTKYVGLYNSVQVVVVEVSTRDRRRDLYAAKYKQRC